MKLRLESRSTTFAALLSLLGAAACSGTPSPVGETDGGEDAQSSVDGGTGSPSSDSGEPGSDATTADAEVDAASDTGVSNDGAIKDDASTDGASTTDAASTDGDTGATPDGGESSDGGVDATSSSDGSTDAPPDGSTGLVTVHVTLGGAPEANVLVAFDDAQGSLLTSGTTDASGSFASVVPAGSQVTVVFAHGTTVLLQTITALAPGDVLTAVDTGLGASPTAQINVTALPANPPSGTSEYNVTAGTQCGAVEQAANFGTGAYLLDLPPTCQQPGQVSLLATADDSTSTEHAYTFADRVSLADAGAAPSGDVPVAFTRPWSPSMTMTLTTPINPLPIADLVYEESSAGTITVSEAHGGASDPDAGIVSFPANMHPGYPDAVQVEASVVEKTSVPGFLAAQARATRIAPPTTGGTIAIDLSSMLPAITSASLTVDGGVTSALVWTPAAPLTDADGLVANVSGGTADGFGMSWTFFGPATTTTFRLPTLPASVHSFNLDALAATWPTVYAVDVASFGSYADFKPSFASFTEGIGFTQDLSFGIVPILPALGSARATAFIQQ